MNFLLRTDSYKFTHWKQYPPKTTGIYSYLESRGGMFSATVFFGLQYYLRTYLQGSVFTKADIEQADEFCRQHFGQDLFNREAGHACCKNTQAACRSASRRSPKGRWSRTSMCW